MQTNGWRRAKGDPLEAIDRLMPWESFRAEIEAVVLTPDEMRKSSARNLRPSWRVFAVGAKENAMVDDRTKRGGADPRRIAQDEPYEVSYFAKKHGISHDQAKEIINQTRGNRVKADAEAAKWAR